MLYCPSAEIVAAPALSRKEAEKVFWEYENRGFDDDEEEEEDE